MRLIRVYQLVGNLNWNRGIDSKLNYKRRVTTNLSKVLIRQCINLIILLHSYGENHIKTT